jgi:hypothetical protein
LPGRLYVEPFRTSTGGGFRWQWIILLAGFGLP